MKKYLSIVTIAALGLAGCGETTEAPAPAVTKASTPAPSASVDTPTTAAKQEPPSAIKDYDDSGVALEAYVDVARPVFEAEMARFSDMYRKIDLAAVGPNTMYYIYTYRDYVDAGRVRAHLAAEDATFDGLAGAIKLELRQAGVENPKINWVYLNSDGAHIATIEK